MAVKLPDAQDLGLVLPQADRPIVSYRGGIAEEGQIAQGQALAKFGQDMSAGAGEIQTAHDKVNYASAYNTFLQKKLDIDTQFQTDKDFATAPQRYGQALQDASTQAGSVIQSSDLRSQFEDTTARMREYGINSILHQSYAKGMDAQRAQLDTVLNDTANGAMAAKDDGTRNAILANGAAAIHASADAGYITRQEEAQRLIAFPQQYAERLAHLTALQNPGVAAEMFGSHPPQLAAALPLSSQIAIRSATQQVPGADQEVLARTAQIEAPHPGASPYNPKSSATGLFQVLKGTAGRYGMSRADMLDDNKNAYVAAQEQVKNKTLLTADLGRDPTGAELYLAHQQGGGGAEALIKNPDMNAVGALVAAGVPEDQAKKSIVNNGGTLNMTAGAFVDGWTRKYNAQPGLTAPATGDGVGTPRVTGTVFDKARPEVLAEIGKGAEAYAKQLNEAADVQSQRAERQRQEAVKMASDNAMSRVIADTQGVGENKDITAQQIADPNGPYKDLTPGARIQATAFMERQNKPEAAAAVSHQVAIGLVDDIRKGRVTDMGPIFDAYTRKDEDGKPNGLTTADFNFVQGQFQQMRTPEGQRLDQTVAKFLQAVKPSIDKSNPLMGTLDMSGGSNFYRLQQDLAAKVAEYRKAGKDPFTLLDPGSPDFIGKPQSLMPYQNSIPESIAEFAERMRKQAAPTSKPGAKTPRPSLDSILGPPLPASQRAVTPAELAP